MWLLLGLLRTLQYLRSWFSMVEDKVKKLKERDSISRFKGLFWCFWSKHPYYGPSILFVKEIFINRIIESEFVSPRWQKSTNTVWIQFMILPKCRVFFFLQILVPMAKKLQICQVNVWRINFSSQSRFKYRICTTGNYNFEKYCHCKISLTFPQCYLWFLQYKIII